MAGEYILTSEEFSYALAFCGYDGLAYSVLKESVGEVSEEGMALIFQTAARSLFTKGILLNLDEENPESAFIEGFKPMLDDIAGSHHMVRAYNENENGQFVLTAHAGSEKKVIFHLVSNQIVHVLSEMEPAGLIEEMTTFFQPKFSGWGSLEFNLPEEEFNTFIELVRANELSGYGAETLKFAEDFTEANGNIVNLSLIRTEDDGLPEMLEVVLLLVGKERTWTIREKVNFDGEKEIVFKSIDESEWKHLAGSFAAGLENVKLI